MAYAKLIGAQVKRKEDPRLIRGTGMYVGDLKLPGMHYVAFVRSPYAHARINSIDTEAARQIPGVFAVVTAHDIESLCEPMPVASSGEGSSESNEKTAPRTHLVLSMDRVRHVGEAVALVIATSPEIAADAADAVEIDWEPLPAVADMIKALEPDAPRLF